MKRTQSSALSSSLINSRVRRLARLFAFKSVFGDCEENQVQKVNKITKVFVCVIAHLVDHLVNNIVATTEYTHIQTLLIATIHAVATPYEKFQTI